MPSTDSSPCPKCGTALPPNAPEALCPICLGVSALADASVPCDGESIGDNIGRYRLLEKIGEGGFGAVYMAEQREPVTRKVALKIIKLGMDTRQVIARFESERQALALMDHPNIARILDAGATQSGRPYFVMELVRGVPIMQFCQKNTLNQSDRLGLFLDVCAAVQHAHQKGVIHRDLKPNNVLVTMNDDKPMPKVIDFGIAKATSGKLTDQTLFTQFHQFIGTPAYMSPEQAQMNATDVDTRTDIYALGVLLYELLTGTTPIPNDKLRTEGQEAVFRMIREEEPSKPSTRVTEMRKRASDPSKPRIPSAEIPQDLDWVVMRALEKDRRRRYETANGLALDVQRFLNNEPVSAAAPSTIYQLRKFLARHRTVALTGAAVVASLLIGLVIATVFYVQEKEARTEVEKREQSLLAANYSQDMEAVGRAFARDQGSLARKILERFLPRSREPDQREWLWRYRMGQLHRASIASVSLEYGAKTITLSPDGSTLAYMTNGRDRIDFLSVPDLVITQTVEIPTSWFHGFFSRDGREFIVPSDGIPMAIDLSTLERRQVVPDIEIQQDSVGLLAPNGEWMIEISKAPAPNKKSPNRCVLTCLEVPTGQRGKSTELFLFPDRYTISDEIRISPDSRFVTLCLRDSTVRLFEIPSMEEVAQLPLQEQASGVAWSRDARLLAITYDYPSDVELWEVVPKPKHLRTLSRGNEHYSAGNLAFSPDGRFLALALQGNGIEVWNVETGEMIDRFLTRAWQVEFLPDSRLVSAGAGVHLWQAPEKKPVTDLRRISIEAELWNLAYSKDGALLAATARDGIVRLFDASTEQLVHAYPLRRTPGGHRPPYGGAPLLFAPDGRTLIAANGDHTVSVLDIVTRLEKFLLENHEAAIADMALTPDGAILATTGEEVMMILWDLKTGQEIKRFPHPSPKWIDFSPVPGSRLLAFRNSGRKSIGLLDLHTNQRRHFPSGGEIWSIKFTPDGRQFIAGIHGAGSRVYDVQTFHRVGTLPPIEGKVEFNYSPDRRNLALASWGHDAQIWHVDTGRSLGSVPLPVPHSWTYAAVFSPDGNTLAVSTRDNGVFLLTAPSFKELENEAP